MKIKIEDIKTVLQSVTNVLNLLEAAGIQEIDLAALENMFPKKTA